MRARRRAPALLALTRLVVGAVFLAVGVTHFSSHEREVADFTRWQLPFPEVAPYAVGAVEVLAGGLLVAGLRSRLAALVLAADMVGALATAGRIDGGMQLVIPPLLLAACLLLAALGGGALRPGGSGRRP